MTKREQLLQLAATIKEPLFDDMGSWQGCIEVGIATADGYVPKSIQDGTCGPEGPVKLTRKLHKKFSDLVEEGPDAVQEALDDWDGEEDEVELLDAVAMVKAACVPGRKYYKLAPVPLDGLDEVLDGVGTDLLFAEDEEDLRRRWYESLAESLDGMEPWGEMDDAELEARLEGVGLMLNPE